MNRLTTGFTLIELMVVLLILSALFGWLIIPEYQRLTSTKYQQTQQQLLQLKGELLSYLAVNKRLPCPASAMSQGQEALLTSACQFENGFFPATSLSSYGFRNNDLLLVDAWQNPIRYSLTSIDNNTNGVVDWTNSADLSNLSTSSLVLGNLVICQDTHCNQKLASDVVAVIFSTGPSQLDAELDKFNSQGHVLHGQNHVYHISNRNEFIFSPIASESQNFNDILVWISPIETVRHLIQ